MCGPRDCIKTTPFIALNTLILRHTPPRTATRDSAPKSYIVLMAVHYVHWFSRLFFALKRRVHGRDDAITTHDRRDTHTHSARANRGRGARYIYVHIYFIVYHRQTRSAAVDDASQGVPTLGILNHPGGCARVDSRAFRVAPRATDARIERGYAKAGYFARAAVSFGARHERGARRRGD